MPVEYRKGGRDQVESDDLDILFFSGNGARNVINVVFYSAKCIENSKIGNANLGRNCSRRQIREMIAS